MTKEAFSLLLPSLLTVKKKQSQRNTAINLWAKCAFVKLVVSMCFSSQLDSHLLPWEWVYMGLVQEVAEVQVLVEEAECLKDSALPL